MKNFILTALCCLLIIPAQAQQSNKRKGLTDSIYTIDEVVVTSKRKAKIDLLKLDVPTKYFPVSTNALTFGMLDKRNIRDIQEASRFLPGVHFRTSYGGFTQFSVRGFGNSVILIDGIRDERSSIDNSYPFMDLSSVESIELLKGPASVLYGQSVVGGVLNIVRKTPTDKQSLYARLAYGSYYNKQATMGFGGKLVGPLNYYVNLNWQDQEGWRNNGTKRLSGYLAVNGKLSDKDEVDFRYGLFRDYYPTEIGLPPTMSYDIYSVADNSKYLNKGDILPNLDKTWRYNSESDFFYNRNFNVSAMYKHTFSEKVKVMDKISYSHDDIDYFGTEELDYLESSSPKYKHYYTTSSNKKMYICLDSLYYGYPLRFSHIANTLNNQLEVSGKFYTGSIKHNYLGGYSFIYLHRDSYSAYGSDGTGVTGPGSTGIGTTYNPHSIGWMEAPFRFVTPQRTYMHGFYLQDLVELKDNLKLLLAGRYDIYRYKRTSGVTTINGKRDYTEPADDAFNKVTTHAFTFKAGLVYMPFDNLSIFGSYGTYFKPIRTFYNNNTIYVDKDGKEFTPKDGSEVFKPEKGGQIELGFRYDITKTLQANASLFYINKYNITRTLASKGDVVNGTKLTKNVIGQVGKMDSRGFDIDLTWTPIYNMSLSAGYSYTNAKVREIADNSYLSSDASKGKQFTYIPKNTFYTYGAYTVSNGVLKGLGVNMDVTFQDKLYRNSSNTTYFDSYWLADMGFSYTMRNKIRIGFNINNLFDKDYTNQSLGNQLVPSMPRNYMVSISYTL